MKIANITEEAIIFDNGNTITFDHEQDCCECNFADFTYINADHVNYAFDFDPDNMIFEFIPEIGFRFGSKPIAGSDDDYGDWIHWLFVPCYSEQNGYYTTQIDIYYNGEIVVSGCCEEHVE